MKHELTKREKEIISVLVTGKSNDEIGKELHVSVNTVRTHLANCYKKVKVKNRIELIIKYINEKQKL